MGRKFSNIMLLGAVAIMGSVALPTCFNTFDSYNPSSIDNSKKHKAKAKKAKAKRNRKR